MCHMLFTLPSPCRCKKCPILVFLSAELYSLDFRIYKQDQYLHGSWELQLKSPTAAA